MLKYIATISMLCLGLTLATPAAAQNCDNRG